MIPEAPGQSPVLPEAFISLRWRLRVFFLLEKGVWQKSGGKTVDFSFPAGVSPIPDFFSLLPLQAMVWLDDQTFLNCAQWRTRGVLPISEGRHLRQILPGTGLGPDVASPVGGGALFTRSPRVIPGVTRG